MTAPANINAAECRSRASVAARKEVGESGELNRRSTPPLAVE